MFDWQLACPQCKTRLDRIASDAARCPLDAIVYRCVDGIWRLLPPDRLVTLQPFIDRYETIRDAEGWGAEESGYYRALPFEDRSGQRVDLWRIRARNFQTALDRVVKPIEQRLRRPLRIVDVGAGNGWLSYRLAQRGHVVAAIDLLTNARDGLGAYRCYDAEFTPIQAEFDALPLADHQADAVVFNGALHYSTDYAVTLREALRVLTPGGGVIALDSPCYFEARSGQAMASERAADFARRYGVPTDVASHENFLTPQRLRELSAELGVTWQFHQRWRGWPARLRAWRARFTGTRELAHMPVIVGVRS